MPGVDKLYPITPAADFRPSWIKSAAAKYKETCSHFPQKKVTSVLKCPGIVDYVPKPLHQGLRSSFASKITKTKLQTIFDIVDLI